MLGGKRRYCLDLAEGVSRDTGVDLVFLADGQVDAARLGARYDAVLLDADHSIEDFAEWLNLWRRNGPLIRVGARGNVVGDADDWLSEAECRGPAAIRVIRQAVSLWQTRRGLEAAQQEAEEARQAKNAALAAMSYNLRTPLNTILGLLELIESGVIGTCDNERIAEYLKDIHSAGRSLFHVVDELLHVAGIDLALASNEGHYRQLIDMSPDTVVVCQDGAISLINLAGAALFGARQPADLEGRPFGSLVHPDYRDLVEDNFQALIEEASAVPMRFLRGAEAIDVMVSAVPKANDPGCVLLVVRNITDLMKATRGILDRNKRLNSILQMAVDAIIVYGADGSVETFNHSAEEMFGFQAAEIVGKQVTALLPDLRAGGQLVSTERETVGRRRNGVKFPVDVALSETRLDDRTIFTAIIRDITERKRIEEHLIHSASHDSLTGLPNRVLLRDRLEQAISHSHGTGALVAVLFLDLDGFKTVNNTLGHLAGDELVVKVGERLAAARRRPDTVARFSGDEFTYLMTEVEDVEAIVDAAQQLVMAFDAPFLVRERKVIVTVSVGISVYPRDGGTASDLIARAGLAMLEAKRAGRNQVRFFDPLMNRQAVERLTLEHALRQGIEQEEFCLHYQPQVSLRTGQVTGMEALVRWNHPALGLVPPNKFIPIAEETGLIIQLGAWVLHQACRDVRKLHDMGFACLRVAVNMSGSQLVETNIVEVIEGVLRDTGIDPKTLDIEITESMLMSEPEKAAELLAHIKRLGVRVSIDDFGTGFSSLSYLKRFPIDTIKIDRSFIRGIAVDQKDRSITNSIITLAHSMGLVALAEGVEEDSQFLALLSDECDEVQGYGVCRPLAFDKVVSFIERWDARKFAKV